MPKVHGVGGHLSEQITDFTSVIWVTLCGAVMSLERLRRYCGGEFVALRVWPIFLAALILPLVPMGASAQEKSDAQAAWVSEAGKASIYSAKYQGRRTAFGTSFDQKKLTAAHPWLPFGTKVRVTLVGTGKSVIVTITDRMSAKRCVIDLSTAAARLLGIMGGTAQVSLAPA
jgi:hypothetical protein